MEVKPEVLFYATFFFLKNQFGFVSSTGQVGLSLPRLPVYICQPSCLSGCRECWTENRSQGSCEGRARLWKAGGPQTEPWRAGRPVPFLEPAGTCWNLPPPAHLPFLPLPADREQGLCTIQLSSVRLDTELLLRVWRYTLVLGVNPQCPHSHTVEDVWQSTACLPPVSQKHPHLGPPEGPHPQGFPTRDSRTSCRKAA